MRKGLLIHPDELSKKWIDRAAAQGIGVLGIHPAGGDGAANSLRELLVLTKTDRFRGLIDYAKSKGMEIEYEMHAAEYLLDRDLFDAKPELFRMDENGQRTKRFNCCVSAWEALERIAKNAAELVLHLYGSCDRFYFWPDDATGRRCYCEKCRGLSASDQQLILVNRMLKEIRKNRPEARMAYLAYYDTLEPPRTVRPADGVFLEYAPMEKYTVKDSEVIRKEAESLDHSLAFFGRKDSQVLEYWLDNSMYSGWIKPPKRFSCERESIQTDIAVYRRKGFESITTFACYLGEDYEALYGEPDITPYTEAFNFE